MIFPGMLARLAPLAGRKGALSILIFHRVRPKPDPLFPGEVDARRFDELLGWLRGYRVLPLDEAVDALQAGTVPARALSITFDDGYADNHDVALPILRRHGMTATFFIATGFLDGGRMWNDTVVESVRHCRADMLDLESAGLGRHALRSAQERGAAAGALLSKLKYLPFEARLEGVDAVAKAAGVRLPDDLMMSSEQVRAMRQAGMQIGGHTRRHPILARLPDVQAQEEISGCKADLEALLDEPVTLFAYPNGGPGKDYGARHCDMVRRAGFKAAVTTAAGVSRVDTDAMQLPRFTPWDRTPMRFGARLLLNMRHDGLVAAT